jgi:anti-sigma regulatory factor (Ser/Thr protein kinase)
VTDEPSLIHQVLLYEGAQQFLGAVLPFVREGLDAGEPVLMVNTEANCSLLREALGKSATDVQFINSTSWYDSPGRTLAACHRYVQERLVGHDRIRVVGEPVWSGWDKLQTAGWKRFEATINIAFAAAPAWMICSYDQRALPAQVLADARRTHPELSGGQQCAEYEPSGLSQWQLELTPPPKGGYVAMRFDGDPAPVRHFVAAQGARLGLTARRLDDLILAVNEVATNSIRHGAGHGQVRLWRDDRYVLCEVFDPGQATDKVFGCVPPDPVSEGGHGMWITRQLCDLVEVRAHPRGTTVRLHIRHP